MDALNLLYPAASELLSCSDRVLARAGAPEGHEILRLLRLVGRLPGDVVTEMAAWDPAALDECADVLERVAGQHSDLTDRLQAPAGWEGKAASAFEARLSSAAEQSGELASSAASLAAHYTDLAAWLRVARRELAQTLGRVLGSAEAVSLTLPATEPLERSAAATRIGTIVLRDAERFHLACNDFATTWPRPAATLPPTAALFLPSNRLRADDLG